MSTMSTSVETVNSSDWDLLSEFLCPNFDINTNNVLLDPIKDNTKEYSDAWTSYDDGSQGMYDDISTDDYVDKPIQVCILDKAFQTVWSTDCSFYPQRDSPTELASTVNYVCPTEPLLSELVFKDPPISTADVGIQTMTTSIHRFPVDCHSHFVPWGLNTGDPSPLTVHNNTSDNSYNGNKRKFEDCAEWDDSNWPPRKRTALENRDYGYLNNLFDYLNPPSINNEYVAIKEERITEPPINCKYEGFIEVDYSDFEIRSVSTNTIHVPMKSLPLKHARSRTWSHSAKQFLSVEDRDDKRGPRQGTPEDRNQRMVNTIMAYYYR